MSAARRSVPSRRPRTLDRAHAGKPHERSCPNTKAELLSNVVEHVDITAYDARPVIDAMRKMSFTSRDTARAADILSMAIEDQACSVWITLAGSTSAGGCMHVYRDMLKYGMADVVVATGASIIDMDFFEALGFKHYQAQGDVDDRDLRALYIDRIYDTYIDEEELQACDHAIKEIADGLEPRPYSSREFIHEIGSWLAAGNAKKPGSLIQTAYEEGCPIFCPAFTDSSAGFGLVKHQVERIKARQPYVTIDSVADFRELTDIKIAAGTTGLFMVGGGVPKNFAQDTVVCAEILGDRGGDAQIRRADHRRRRARRRLLVLDAQGGLLLGQGRRHLRTDGVRRGHHRRAADRLRRLASRRLDAAGKSAASPSCSTEWRTPRHDALPPASSRGRL